MMIALFPKWHPLLVCIVKQYLFTSRKIVIEPKTEQIYTRQSSGSLCPKWQTTIMYISTTYVKSPIYNTTIKQIRGGLEKGIYCVLWGFYNREWSEALMWPLRSGFVCFNGMLLQWLMFFKIYFHSIKSLFTHFV